MRGLAHVKENAMREDEHGRMIDRRAAINASVEMLKVQGKFAIHRESVSVQVTTEGRMRAKVLGLGLNEYVNGSRRGPCRRCRRA